MIYDAETTCDDVIAAWDRGDPIWTVEMGGLGSPGYEQCIQVLMVELLRSPAFRACVPAKAGNAWVGGTEAMEAARRSVYDAKCKGLGMSGAQVGAATGLASAFLMMGPHAAVESVARERRIQASNCWPRAEAVSA